MKTNRVFQTLKKVNVGLRSRRSARAISNLVGMELTSSELQSMMTNEKEIPLIKSHDWWFNEDDTPIIFENDGYCIKLNVHSFIEDLKKGEMQRATFTLSLKPTRKRRKGEVVYLVEDFSLIFRTVELCNKLSWETIPYFPHHFNYHNGRLWATHEIA